VRRLSEVVIETVDLGYTYMKGTPMARQALHGVNVAIRRGELVAIIGRTGSGKSTLIQHFNGLLRPDEGQIKVMGQDIWSKGVSLRDVRRRVGLVFQYPEHQLFEETVEADISFAPRSMGMTQVQVEEAVREAMRIVNLDYDSLRSRSPFDLSGGQKRRVAIAGVLAMGPEVLVLDEPTAGMDPRGREEVLQEVADLHEKHGYTVVLVSHSMEDVARYAQRLIVMDRGTVVMEGPPHEVFRHRDTLIGIGLGVPQVTDLVHELRGMGHPLPEDVVTLEQAMEVLVPLLAGWPNGHGQGKGQRHGHGCGHGEGQSQGQGQAQGSWDGERV
jgi:energy-coupling factor transport system ATP-binding protein